MPDRNKALLAVIAVGVASVLLLMYVHATGQGEYKLWSGPILWIAVASYSFILLWLTLRLRTSKRPPHSDSN
jgi:hypothetical protein